MNLATRMRVIITDLLIKIMPVTLSHDSHTARSTALGTVATDAIPKVYFQSRIHATIQQHVDACKAFLLLARDSSVVCDVTRT